MRIAKPSLRARFFSAIYRLVIRRRSWGRDDAAVARRARRLFDTPHPARWFGGRGLKVEAVVVGGGARGERLTPAGGAARGGIVMYVHGGGYVSCTAATHRPITGALARLTSLPVFAVEYRLAPEHRCPAALDDAVAAYRQLLDEGFAGERIALAGDSAGGGLVLALLVRLREEGFPAPACAVCFSPWTDMTRSGASVAANDGRCAMFRPESITQFASVYLGGTAAECESASPLFANLGGLPPVLLHVGSTELLLDDSRRVHKKIQAARGSRKPRAASRIRVFKDAPHCWQMLDPFVPEARRSLTEAAEFIRSHVGA